MTVVSTYPVTVVTTFPVTVVTTFPVTVITTFLTPVVKSAIGSINDCFLFTHHPSCVVPVFKVL